MPTPQQFRHFCRRDPRGVFGEETPLGHGVEAAEQPQSFVGDQRHDVALALNRPKLQRECGAQRMLGRNQARARQAGVHRQRLGIEANQIGDEQEQAADPGREFPGGWSKSTNVSDGFRGGPNRFEALLIEPTWQGGKALLEENLSHGRGAERRSLFFEHAADVVDGVVALPERHELIADLALLGLLARSGPPDGKELREPTAAEIVTQHAERGRRVAKPLRCVCGRQAFQIVGPQGLVLPLACRFRPLEKAATFRQANWRSDRHAATMSIFANRVNGYFHLTPINRQKSPVLLMLPRNVAGRSATRYSWCRGRETLIN